MEQQLVSRRISFVVLAVAALAWAATAAQAPFAPADGDGAVPLWHVDVPARGAPAVQDAFVYALSSRREVVAIERRTGRVAWRRSTAVLGGGETGGSIVRVAGQVVVAGDDDLIAFGAGDGRLLWRFVPREGYGVGHYVGAVEAGTIYGGSASGHLHAVDVESGRARWTTEVGGAETTVFDPVAAGGLVAAGFNQSAFHGAGGVVVVDARDGVERWRQIFTGRERRPSAGWGGGLVFAGDEVVATGMDGAIRAFDRASGSPRWVIEAPDEPCAPPPERPDHRPLVLAGRRLVAGSLTGCVTAWNLDTHEVEWRYHERRLGSTATRMSVAGEVVYVPFLSGRVVALDAGTGAERWRVGAAAHEFIWPPAVAGGRVILTSRAGVFAFATREELVPWQCDPGSSPPDCSRGGVRSLP